MLRVIFDLNVYLKNYHAHFLLATPILGPGLRLLGIFIISAEMLLMGFEENMLFDTK